MERVSDRKGFDLQTSFGRVGVFSTTLHYTYPLSETVLFVDLEIVGVSSQSGRVHLTRKRLHRMEYVHTIRVSTPVTIGFQNGFWVICFLIAMSITAAIPVVKNLKIFQKSPLTSMSLYTIPPPPSIELMCTSS